MAFCEMGLLYQSVLRIPTCMNLVTSNRVFDDACIFQTPMCIAFCFI